MWCVARVTCLVHVITNKLYIINIKREARQLFTSAETHRTEVGSGTAFDHLVPQRVLWAG